MDVKKYIGFSFESLHLIKAYRIVLCSQLIYLQTCLWEKVVCKDDVPIQCNGVWKFKGNLFFCTIFNHFSCIWPAIFLISIWFTYEVKKNQTNKQNKTNKIKKEIMQIQPVLSFCDIKIKTYIIFLSLI